jgi:glycerophosphoryl diester phosphodiesterase
VPKTKSDPFDSPWRKYLAYPALGAYRAHLPARARGGIRAGRFDAVMAHWRLVTPSLLRAIHRAGGELYVWTVDDRERIERLAALGVTGVITNDPRLFAT